MARDIDQPHDDTRIDFRFETYGDLKRVFGARAASLLKAKERKERFGNGGPPVLTATDLDIARRFIRGETVGAQSGKALRVFKAYFMGNDQRRRTFEAFLGSQAKALNGNRPQEPSPSDD